MRNEQGKKKNNFIPKTKKRRNVNIMALRKDTNDKNEWEKRKRKKKGNWEGYLRRFQLFN